MGNPLFACLVPILDTVWDTMIDPYLTPIKVLMIGSSCRKMRQIVTGCKAPHVGLRVCVSSFATVFAITNSAWRTRIHTLKCYDFGGLLLEWIWKQMPALQSLYLVFCTNVRIGKAKFPPHLYICNSTFADTNWDIYSLSNCKHLIIRGSMAKFINNMLFGDFILHPIGIESIVLINSKISQTRLQLNPAFSSIQSLTLQNSTTNATSVTLLPNVKNLEITMWNTSSDVLFVDAQHLRSLRLCAIMTNVALKINDLSNIERLKLDLCDGLRHIPPTPNATHIAISNCYHLVSSLATCSISFQAHKCHNLQLTHCFHKSNNEKQTCSISNIKSLDWRAFSNTNNAQITIHAIGSFVCEDALKEMFVQVIE